MSRWTRRLPASLAVLVLATVAGACTGGETRTSNRDIVDRPLRSDSEARGAGEGDPLAFLPTGAGAAYDRAVARMVRTNHLLEERQAELSFARQEGAGATVIADLRRQVGALETAYAKAITAMTTVSRVGVGAGK